MVSHGIIGWVVGIDVDALACVGAVSRGHLRPLATLWTLNEHRFAPFEAVEALEEVDAVQRNSLPGATMTAGVGDALKGQSGIAHGGIAQAG